MSDTMNGRNFRVMTSSYRDGMLIEGSRVVDRADSSLELIGRLDAHVGSMLRDCAGSTASYDQITREFRVEFPKYTANDSHVVTYVRAAS